MNRYSRTIFVGLLFVLAAAVALVEKKAWEKSSCLTDTVFAAETTE